MRLSIAWWSLLVSGFLWTSSVAAKKDKPAVHPTSFPFWPYNVNYFDDSDVLLFEDPNDQVVYRSTDAGVSWKTVSGVPGGKEVEMIMHPYDNKKAYIITGGKSHWMTKDRGERWEEFYTDSQPSVFRPALSFHAKDPDRIIFNGMDCSSIFCEEITMYTTNGFATDTRFLRSDTDGCHWAVSSPQFTTGQKDLDDNRIICVTKGRFSPWRKDFRLLISDNFFTSNGDDIQEFEPELEPGRTVQGIVNMDGVSRYLVVAASSAGTDEMALYVSDDTIKWHKAIFSSDPSMPDHKVRENGYTILESTNYSIQIDVLNTRPSNPMGVFFSSNSNGTYFTRNAEYTNRWTNGFVDFEKVAGVQGIVLINTVANGKTVDENSGEKKKIKSQISFDDGRTWTGLKTKKNNKDLHLHSVTDLDNVGRVFSSPAPGIVMGIGNTGDYLKDFKDGNLYVSDDAGLTWYKGLEGPHKYEFGDQGSILVAIKDEVTDEVKYSLNHGKDWDTVKLDKPVKPVQLTTTADSTSLKFLLQAAEDKQDNGEGYIIVLDFNDMHEEKCKSDDMEEWFARRVGEDGNPTCVMGHEQSYIRRKADAKCFIMKEFVDPEPKLTPCACTDADFECDYNFLRSADRKECNRAGNLVLPEGACKAFGPEDTFKASSGWRLIPGNDCKRESGPQKDDLVDRKCAEAVGDPLSGEISHTQKTFDAKEFKNKVYLERTDSSTGEDETVLMRTENGVFLSHDHGKKWDQILKDEEIDAIYPNPYFNDMVFFITPTKKVFYSTNRGENIRDFLAENEPNQQGLPVLKFHPKNKDWFIWTGAKDCDSKSTCHSVASLTEDRGDHWRTLQRYVRKCEFINPLERKDRDEKLIYCEVRDEDNLKNPLKLVSSNDFFAASPKVHFENVVDFATMAEFIVVATKDDAHSTLKVDASVDGTTFADAEFPHGFVVDHQEGYTVLDSSTHSMFLHVTVNNQESLEYGTIVKSNSNGTSYVLAIDAVDRNTRGYVDFEKMAGIEGVAIVNVVANYKSKDYAKEGKKLKTMITHNDGAEWDYVTPPEKDADGKPFGCSGSLNKCSLQIHGYTERTDKSHVYYSQSAIGLMLGTGNVGEYLDNKQIDTFMTADGGVTWKSAKKGQYMWEFGDQGSIVVIVKERTPTNILHYTLDEGETWKDYKFSDEEITVEDITTVPSDNARNFLLWGRNGREILTINIDFTGLTDVQCKLDENNVEGEDYYLWTPKHPKQDDDCLFGHVSQYHRKRPESKCYNGRMIPWLHEIAKNCTCSRRDFECDFNYERQTDGTCALVQGYSPPDHSLTCAANENKDEWFTPTGYRRIPITTCQGGREMDKSLAHPCPGHEDNFNKKHSASGVAIFFAVVIPIAAAAGVGYWVWRNWASKFGQIRLGEQSSFDGEAPWIKYPVLVIAGIAAIVQAIPLLATSLWRSASGMMGRGGSRRFTTRDSFARGRGDYDVVDTDEGELLGEDSDEDV